MSRSIVRGSAPILATAALLLAAPTAQAQELAGVTIHFSGYLTDLSNNPVNGFVDVQLRILDEPMGGNELFFEVHQGVEVNDGALELDIGSVEPLTGGVFEVVDGKLTGSGRFIGITLDGDRQEMLPRFPVPVVPFAVQSLLGSGAEGPQGPAGPEGAAGPQGEPGAMGPMGPQGLEGPMGPAGARGPQGPAGDDGVSATVAMIPVGDGRCATGGVEVVGVGGNVHICNGVSGVDGVDGVDGVSVTTVSVPVGDPDCPFGGVKVLAAAGDEYVCNGAPGAQGAVGAVGPVGPQGVQGVQGPAGNDGADGATGPQGVQGPVGPQGPAGMSVTTMALASGDIQCPTGGVAVTGAFGTEYVCNGPTGLQGPAGSDGADGAQGPQGPIGLTGPTGPQGPQGPAGNDGADGAVGAQGPQGPAGPTGAQGVAGPVGPQGATGAQGTTGLTGPAGPTGAQGPQGLAGNDGADGATGPQGPIGLTGPAGPTGAQGAAGATGPQGPIGLTGPAGPTGAQGAAGATGAQGPAGPTGPQGPAGPAGGGINLVDNNANNLGQVVYADGYGITLLTSTGHIVYLNWDGTISPGQIYYTGGGCTGTAYLNSGWSGSGPIWGKQVVYSGSFGSLMIPTNLDANNMTPNVGFTAAAIDNPTCGGSSGTKYGYRLVTTTPAAVGLPGYPIAAPLTLQ